MDDRDIMEQIKHLMDNAEEDIDDLSITSQISELLNRAQNRDALLEELAEDGYELGTASRRV